MSTGAGFRDFQRAVSRRLVDARGTLSQNRLAGELGYSQQMISRYEGGRIPKCFLFLARLAEHKQIDVNWVLAGLGDKSGAEFLPGKPTAVLAPGPAGSEVRLGEEDDQNTTALSEELNPELYEDYESEAVIALSSLWTQAPRSLRKPLADRLRSVILWWKVRDPELAGSLERLSGALDEGVPSYLEALRRIGEQLRMDEGMDSQRRAIRLYKFLLTTYGEPGSDRDRAKALIRLGQMHRKTNQWIKAKEFYTSGLRLAEALGDAVMLEEAWAGLGNLAEDLTDLVSARSYFRKELEAALQTGDAKLRIRSYVSLSLVAAESRQHREEGLEYADSGLALCDLLKDDEYRSELLINKGLILATLGREEEADAAYRDAIGRTPTNKEVRLKAIAYNNRGELALAREDLEEAGELFAQAETWCRQVRIPYVLCSILMNQAKVLLREGRIREAARASWQALRIADKEGLKRSLAEAQALSLEIEEGIPALIKMA